MNLFISELLTNPYYYVTTILIVTFSICVHECAHAWTALKQGDETALWLGHISLNPRIQMGWTSIVVMLLIGFAWGAVPYNPRNLRKPWSGALIAFAGPLANLVLSFLFAGMAAAAFHFMTVASEDNMVYQFLAQASLMNAVLFIFNMMPLPVLDGWKVLSLFIPDMSRLPSQHASSITWLGMAFLLTRGSFIIWGGGDSISNAFFRVWHLVI